MGHKNYENYPRNECFSGRTGKKNDIYPKSLESNRNPEVFKTLFEPDRTSKRNPLRQYAEKKFLFIDSFYILVVQLRLT